MTDGKVGEGGNQVSVCRYTNVDLGPGQSDSGNSYKIELGWREECVLQEEGARRPDRQRKRKCTPEVIFCVV